MNIKEIINEEIQRLHESSISRIKHWINSKDIAGITAFREKLTNTTKNTLLDKKEGELYSTKENRDRNHKLKASLIKLGYGVTKVAGSYVEGGNEVQEESFIVVNLNDDPKFKEKIFKLSEYFNQDSFLYKEKGDNIAYLVGTNINGFPKYGDEHPVGEFYDKVNATYMSRVGSQGFAFSFDNEDNPLSNHKPHTFADRKKQRKDNMGINEIIELFEMETFDRLSRNNKWGCTIISRPVINGCDLL